MAKLNMFILLLMLTTITLMTTGCEKPVSEQKIILGTRAWWQKIRTKTKNTKEEEYKDRAIRR